jgi:hypothetical protein
MVMMHLRMAKSREGQMFMAKRKQFPEICFFGQKKWHTQSSGHVCALLGIFAFKTYSDMNIRYKTCD